MNDLAVFGGPPIITEPFKKYNTMGADEATAAKNVIDSGILSSYLGAWGESFYGGPKVREFETKLASYFGVKHAVTVNSWTSGLIAAVGAIGIEPGDEIIVTPWTMSATAAAILHWNAIPVFADIDADTYNLSPSSIKNNITSKTKAIMVADIFGQSADMDEIMEIARAFNIKVISDTAQAPGARYKESYAGTLAHIGGYSLNYHKHIHTGEGGVLVTNDDSLAQKLKLIRNHAESVVPGLETDDLVNMIGYNFRLGEIECAIGCEQLKKLSNLVKSRQALAMKLDEGLKGLRGLCTPVVRSDRTHVYYVYALQVDSDLLGVHRDLICRALLAEGVPISSRYQNIHLLPVFQRKIAFGSKGFPWTAEFCQRDVNYHKGICPNAERLNDSSYMGIGLCNFDYSTTDIKLICEAFHKVWENLSSLKNLHAR